MAKRSLMEPFDVDEVYKRENSQSLDFEDKILSSDIIKILDQYIPASIRVDYRKFVDGDSLPKNKKEKLIDEIKKIIEEHYLNEDGPTE